jgi:hypothetical protein
MPDAESLGGTIAGAGAQAWLDREAERGLKLLAEVKEKGAGRTYSDAVFPHPRRLFGPVTLIVLGVIVGAGGGALAGPAVLERGPAGDLLVFGGVLAGVFALFFGGGLFWLVRQRKARLVFAGGAVTHHGIVGKGSMQLSDIFCVNAGAGYVFIFGLAGGRLTIPATFRDLGLIAAMLIHHRPQGRGPEVIVGLPEGESLARCRKRVAEELGRRGGVT